MYGRASARMAALCCGERVSRAMAAARVATRRLYRPARRPTRRTHDGVAAPAGGKAHTGQAEARTAAAIIGRACLQPQPSRRTPAPLRARAATRALTGLRTS